MWGHCHRMVVRQPTHQTDGTSGAPSPPSICQHPTVPTCTPGIAGTPVCWKGAPVRGSGGPWGSLREQREQAWAQEHQYPQTHCFCKLRGLSGVPRGWAKEGQSPAPTGMPACCRPPMGCKGFGGEVGAPPTPGAGLPPLPVWAARGGGTGYR